MKNIAIILLAGDSTRFESGCPKQLYQLNGKPLLYYSILPFSKSNHIDKIVVVSKKEYFPLIEKWYNSIDLVEGGATRHESVKNALNFLKGKVDDNDNVLIHDGARLFLEEKHIEGLIGLLEKYQAATLAIPSEDTLGQVSNGLIKSIPDRQSFVKIQTPQAFKFKTIYSLHQKDNMFASDDTQLCLKKGIDVAILAGSKKLNKVTTIEDIALVEKFLKELDK